MLDTQQISIYDNINVEDCFVANIPEGPKCFMHLIKAMLGENVHRSA